MAADGAIPRAVCHMAFPTWSGGIFSGGNPLVASLPLTLLQVTLVVTLSLSIKFLLKPLKQPLVVCQILAGIILGPTVLGRFLNLDETAFPVNSYGLMSTMSRVGIVYFFFTEGVKQDFSALASSGRKAFTIGLTSLFFTFLVTAIAAQSFQPYLYKNPLFLPMLTTSLSITTFPVVQPILAELRLLNSKLGRLGMSTSLVNGITSFLLRMYFQAIKQGTGAMWYFISVFTLAIFITFAVRPIMWWIVWKTPEGRPVGPGYIWTMMLLVLVVGCLSDIIGATIAEGPLLMGLLCPAGPPLGSALVEKIEPYLNTFLLPLFYASLARRINLFAITDWKSFWALQLLMMVAYIAKFVGTVMPSLFHRVPIVDSITLGFMMTFRGLVELLAFAYWDHHQIVDAQTLAGLVISNTVITAVMAPLVAIICARPWMHSLKSYQGRSIQRSSIHSELEVVACIHDQDNCNSLLKLMAVSRPLEESPICIYLLDLVELVGRGYPILSPYKLKPTTKSTRFDHIVTTFQSFTTHLGNSLTTMPFKSVSPYKTMHQDITSLASSRKASLIVVPFYKQFTTSGNATAVNWAFQTVIGNILLEAPCSVGVLVDRPDLCAKLPNRFPYDVGVVFLGGPDDREALAFASRMVEHPDVNITLLRCLLPDCTRREDRGKKIDDKSIRDFRGKTADSGKVVYRELVVVNGEETVNSIRSMGTSKFDLMLVGRRHPDHSQILEGLLDWSESPELGVLGDLLASSDFAWCAASVLVVQQNYADTIW